MTFYIIIWAFSFLLYLLQGATKHPFHKYLIIFLLIIAALFVAIRVDVGADWNSYKHYYYNGYASDRESGTLEQLFAFIRYVCYKLGFSHSVFFLILSMISLYTTYVASRMLKINNYWFVFLIYLSLYFCNYQFNIIRHGLLASFVWLGYTYKSIGETRKALGSILISAGFHVSALFFAPFLFFIDKKYSMKFVIILLVTSLCCYYLGVSQKIMNLFPVLDSFNRLGGYFNRADYEDVYGLTLGVWFNFSFFILSFIFFRKIYDEDAKLRIVLNGLLWGFVICCVLNAFSAIISRLVNLLNMALIFAIPLVFNMIMSKKLIKHSKLLDSISKLLLYLLLIAYLLLYYHISFAQNNEGTSAMLPYKFDFSQLFD